MDISNRWLLVHIGISLLLTACGGSGGGDDDGTNYRYTVTSTSFFTGGQQVAVVRFGISGSCSNITGVTSDLTRVGAGTVTTPGTVSFKFTTDITPPMLESVYIDDNASGNLDSGDLVWGDDPNDFYGACFDNFSTDQSFDWEDIGAQIQAGLGLFQPWIIYTGASQSFRGAQSSGSESTIRNSVIVEGDGYDGIGW